MEILKETVKLWKFFKKEKEGLGLGYKEKSRNFGKEGEYELGFLK
jgi:hypothetical protein